MAFAERRTDGDGGQVRRAAAMNLATRAAVIEARTGTSPWADHEYQRAYGVLVLPFSSGHLLALRVSPQNSFAPYISVWHRPPEGEWSIFVDGPSLETACPRYWGPATRRTALTSIDVTWIGPNELRVEMDEPRLEWTMSMSEPPLLRAVNAMNTSLPLRTWKPEPLVRIREWLVRRFLDLGDIRFSFTTASGHETVFVPEAEYVIHESEAVLDGRSLGAPVRLETNPTIGDVPLPRRPSFVIAQAHMRITDAEEYQRTRERVLDLEDSSDGTARRGHDP